MRKKSKRVSEHNSDSFRSQSKKPAAGRSSSSTSTSKSASRPASASSSVGAGSDSGEKSDLSSVSVVSVPAKKYFARPFNKPLGGKPGAVSGQSPFSKPSKSGGKKLGAKDRPDFAKAGHEGFRPEKSKAASTKTERQDSRDDRGGNRERGLRDERTPRDSAFGTGGAQASGAGGAHTSAAGGAHTSAAGGAHTSGTGGAMIHPPLLAAVRSALTMIFSDGRPADRALETTFKSQRKLGSRDRKFIAEAVYECVRWSRRWQEVAAEVLPQSEVAPEMQVFGALQGWGSSVGLTPDEIEAVKAADAKMSKAPRALRESIGDDLDALVFSELGTTWDKELRALNEKAPVDLRVNTQWITREKLHRLLQDEGIDCVPLADFPETLTLKERKNVFVTDAFKQGYFEVQDRSSQKVAPFMKLQPGMRIIDACAGAGGKTLHIANLMQNKGKVISMDIHAWKLTALEERARRSKFSNIETRLIDSTKVIKRLEESADRVLLDVPCSGLGVLRRNPDSKLRLNADDVERVKVLQAELLQSYARMVKPGGYLVYATCSLLPSENIGQVDAFLAANADKFKLEETWSAFPSEKNGDGFFAARMLRL